jgi:hypothetical protein
MQGTTAKTSSNSGATVVEVQQLVYRHPVASSNGYANAKIISNFNNCFNFRFKVLPSSKVATAFQIKKGLQRPFY